MYVCMYVELMTKLQYLKSTNLHAAKEFCESVLKMECITSEVQFKRRLMYSREKHTAHLLVLCNSCTQSVSDSYVASNSFGKFPLPVDRAAATITYRCILHMQI